jgi:hypothetical protein
MHRSPPDLERRRQPLASPNKNRHSDYRLRLTAAQKTPLASVHHATAKKASPRETSDERPVRDSDVEPAANMHNQGYGMVERYSGMGGYS